MNLSILVLGWIFLFAIGCTQSSRDEQGGQIFVEENTGTADALSCFLYANGRDTVYLALDSWIGDKITGELRYDFFERDGNIGFIEGRISGDTLFADYTFLSEGLVSVREVGFFLGEDQIIEGYGDVEEVDGRMVFWHKDSLDFSNGLVMPKIPCEQLNRQDYTQFFPDSIINQRDSRQH